MHFFDFMRSQRCTHDFLEIIIFDQLKKKKIIKINDITIAFYSLSRPLLNLQSGLAKARSVYNTGYIYFVVKKKIYTRDSSSSNYIIYIIQVQREFVYIYIYV